MNPQKRCFRVIKWVTISVALALIASCQPDHQSSQASVTQHVALPSSVLLSITDEVLRDYIVEMSEKASLEGASGDAIGRLAMTYDANGFDSTAERTYRVAVEKDPSEFQWQYLLARRLQLNGDLSGAIAFANRAIELRDDYPAIYVRQGTWLLDSGEPDAARISFEHAVRLGAGPAAELGVARSLLKTRNHTAALEVLTSVVSRTNHPAAFRLLGDVWRAMGNETKAREYVPFASQSTSMWFDDPIVSTVSSHVKGKGKRIHDIELMLGNGLTNDALQALQAFDATERDDVNVQYHFALAYFQNRSYDVAEQYLRKAIELEPVHYPSHLLLASLYQRHDNNQKASEHLEHVVEIYPKLQIAHQELGFVRLRNGDTNGALESFEAAIDLDSIAPNVHYYAGVIWGSRGNCERAIGHFENTLVLDERHERARMGKSECGRVLPTVDAASLQIPHETQTDAHGLNE